MAASSCTAARAFNLSRISSDFSPIIKKSQPFPPASNIFCRRYSHTVSCLSSSGSGGGISDDFVSTRKETFDRGFSVIANMLKKIEPLDTSVISKGVSESAKDSMKQTISTMLGLLPSDQFSVSVRVSKHPLDRLLISSIITGYTLWNAEYRLSLMRNLDIVSVVEEEENNSKEKNLDCSSSSSKKNEEKLTSAMSGAGEVCSIQDLQISPQVFGDLSPQALTYIQNLQSQLSDAEQELDARKKETMRIECNKGSRNDLLEYLRSLDSEMVSELSRPSSVEVEDIIHQLVQNVVRRFFKDDPTYGFMGDSAIANAESNKDGANAFCNTMGTSRDYLAKLLFWCMLLGHHLRGLENRLHLSCVVGLL